MSKIKITYTYGRYGGGPGAPNAALSNHHILPYFMMQYIGLLWAALARSTTLKDAEKNYGPALDKLLMANRRAQLATVMPLRGEEYIVRADAQEFHQFSSDFAWLPHNLFIGPSGHHRLSDPSQRVEPDKPNSFAGKRWTQLESVWTAVKELGKKLPSSTGTRASIEVSDADAKKIVDAAKACFSTAVNGAHHTTLSDWCAQPATNKAYYPIDITLLAGDALNTKRTNDKTFSWCKMELTSAVQPKELLSTHYVKILEVTTGDKLACIKAEGTPPQQRGAADCPAEFHP